MSTNEFDRLITKKVSQAAYEYNTGDWEKLTIQLVAARRKKRAIVFAYLSSGVAASVAIFLVGIFPMLSKKQMPAIQYTSKPQTHSSAPMALSGSSINMHSSSAQHTSPYNTSPLIAHRKQVQPVQNTVAYNIPQVAYNSPPANASIQSANKQIDTAILQQQLQQHGYESPTLLPYTKTENKLSHRGVNISVAGGVNYGTANTGYAFGAVADKKLTNKFGVEFTVAYVGNTVSAPGSPASYIPPNNQGGGGFLPKPSVVSLPLNYLQCAPMANYSLSKKFTLSAGPDLQRLLQEHDVTVLSNDNTKVAPLIDLGMLLRTEYSISTNLKAGLSYRIGANNIVSSGNNYIDRNYMQVQLRYKLH